jgi:hypothetical protein
LRLKPLLLELLGYPLHVKALVLKSLRHVPNLEVQPAKAEEGDSTQRQKKQGQG